MNNIISPTPKNITGEIQYQPDAIISKVLLKTDALNITLFAVSSGQEFSPHMTPRNALVHILEGECEFMLDKEWYVVKAQDYFFMPKELLHAIRAKSDCKFLLYLFL